MKGAGYAHMGVGSAVGKDKAEEAAKKAIQSPLLETSINGAHGVVLSIIGSSDIGLDEIERAASMVQASAHPDAHIIFGASINEDVDDEIRVVVIATGFDETAKPKDQSAIFSNAKRTAPAYNAAPAYTAPQPQQPVYTAPQQPQQPVYTAPQPQQDDSISPDDPFADIMKIFSSK